MEDWTKDSTPLKTMLACHIHLLACHLNSGKVRMSPSWTGHFALQMAEWLLMPKNSTQIHRPYPTSVPDTLPLSAIMQME